MFYDLELEDECLNIFDKFPWMTFENDKTGPKNKTNNIQMETKVLGKGQRSKLSTTVGQGHCSSTNPLNPIRENGEIVEVEEQKPELLDDNENDDSGMSGDQQPLITFGQACLNNMGATTENLGQSINIRFEVDSENSRNTSPNLHILLRDVNQDQSQGDKLVAISDKL